MTDFKDIRALLEKSASSDDLKRFDALMIEPPESGQIVPSAFQTPLRQSRRSSFEGPTEFSPYGAMPLTLGPKRVYLGYHHIIFV